MRKKEVIRELVRLTTSKVYNQRQSCFHHSLNCSDPKTYSRRSFTDLMEHFNSGRRVTSEDTLMQALQHLGFKARYCSTPQDFVFHLVKQSGITTPNKLFVWHDSFNREFYQRTQRSKYSWRQLQTLWEKHYERHYIMYSPERHSEKY